MTTTLAMSLTLGLIALVVLHYLYWERLSRAWIIRRAFPAEWLVLLKEQLPIYERLPNHLQTQLLDHIKLFLARRKFVGCAGLTITDEICISISSQACLLLLNRPTHEYKDLKYIYVFPTTFKSTRDVRNEIGLVSTESKNLLGESWSNGKLILAWDEVARGAHNFQDGHNVVLHEFAHQLDHETGTTNGVPYLYSKNAYRSWAYVLGKEFETLQHHPHQSIIDEYGATNPAEFFAVSTEQFFEQPEKMYHHHRELFEVLMEYYHLDPREWN